MKSKVFFLSFVFLLLLYYTPIFYEEIQSNTPAVSQHSPKEITTGTKEEIHPLPVTGFENYIGIPIEKYLERHGQPIRVGPSDSDGEWWIFGSNQQDYVQIEVKNEIIQSIFVMGEKVNTGPLRIGMTRENVYDETELGQTFLFESDDVDYQLSLSNNDLDLFPLIRFENNSFVMLFFHPELGRIYGLHFLSPNALLQTHYYHVTFKEEEKSRTVKPTRKVMGNDLAIEKEEQLASFFSIIRNQESLKPLVQTREMDQLAEDIMRRAGKSQLIFDKSINEAIELNEEWKTDSQVKKVEYVVGNGTRDTPTQFGIFMKDAKNQEILLESEWEEWSIKTVEDDFLLLFK